MSADLSIVAIVAAYNEADIIDQVVGDLIAQGIQVYFLDDGSTDGTLAAVERYAGHGVIGIERIAGAREGAPSARFDWERILLRKTELARELEADWFIHHDADEFRESPWSGLSLHDAIRRVDTLGFNAIDFAGLDFRPVHDRFRPGDDVRQAFTSYELSAPYDRVQIRCWKKTTDLDLASSGGHEARFAGRRVFPLRFILRHYPIRGQAHGERKVFAERQGRFRPQERDRGWHRQYDDVHAGTSFIRDPADLTPYDPDAVRLALTLRHRGVEEIEDALHDARSVIESRTRDVDVAREELARTRAALGASIAEAATLRDAVMARTAELMAGSAELAVRDAELSARNADLQGHRQEIVHLCDAMRQRAEEVGRWRAVVDDANRRLDAFERSWSWRWTAPIRAVFRLLSGRR